MICCDMQNADDESDMQIKHNKIEHTTVMTFSFSLYKDSSLKHLATHPSPWSVGRTCSEESRGGGGGGSSAANGLPFDRQEIESLL